MFVFQVVCEHFFDALCTSDRILEALQDNLFNMEFRSSLCSLLYLVTERPKTPYQL